MAGTRIVPGHPIFHRTWPTGAGEEELDKSVKEEFRKAAQKNKGGTTVAMG